MKLLVLADLHMEFETFDATDTPADVVILAGDTNLKTKGVEWAREAFADRPVLYIPGNHEYYGETYQRQREKLRNAAAGSNVRLLDCDKYELDGVVFLGATLWTDFKLLGDQRIAMLTAQNVMNDFEEIKTLPGSSRLKPVTTVDWHVEARAWLRAETEAAARADKKVVVITHHLPSIRSIPERYRRDPVSASYASNLEQLVVESGAALWIHGHTHTVCDYMLGDTRVLVNPRGYPHEVPKHTGFKFDLTVEV